MVWLLWWSVLLLQRCNYGWTQPRTFIISARTKCRGERNLLIFSDSLAAGALNGDFRWSQVCLRLSTGEQRSFMLHRWENQIRGDEWSNSLSLCLCFPVIKSLEELTWKRKAFQRSEKENQSKINNQIIGQLPVSKHNKTKPGAKFYTSEYQDGGKWLLNVRREARCHQYVIKLTTLTALYTFT